MSVLRGPVKLCLMGTVEHGMQPRKKRLGSGMVVTEILKVYSVEIQAAEKHVNNTCLWVKRILVCLSKTIRKFLEGQSKPV